jgi:FeS assembly protein IscX
MKEQRIAMAQPLYWDAIYEIVLALKASYPEENLEEATLGDVFRWTLALPNFADDPELANDEILSAIYQEWFEEINPV